MSSLENTHRNEQTKVVFLPNNITWWMTAWNWKIQQQRHLTYAVHFSQNFSFSSIISSFFSSFHSLWTCYWKKYFKLSHLLVVFFLLCFFGRHSRLSLLLLNIRRARKTEITLIGFYRNILLVFYGAFHINCSWFENRNEARNSHNFLTTLPFYPVA